MKKIIAIITSFWIVIVTGGHVWAQSENMEAVITAVEDTKTVVPAGGGPAQVSQNLRLLITSGDKKGQEITLENDNAPVANLRQYQLGDKVVLYNQPETENYTIADVVRRPVLAWLFAIFVVAAIVVGHWQGVTSLLGLAASFVLIFFWIVPRVASGSNPIVMVTAGCLIIIPIMFLLSHGWNKTTLVAMVATLMAMMFTGGLIVIFVQWARLTGLASEEAGFLLAMNPDLLDFRQLLAAGMLFATLGVLDDVTISQAAIVSELKKTDPTLDFWRLYAGASKLGRDHIASMINTLILVYAGASFPLLVLFNQSRESLSLVLNYEIIADEIVRTLTGSIGLIMAVPLTTLLACLVETTKFRAGARRPHHK